MAKKWKSPTKELWQMQSLVVHRLFPTRKSKKRVDLIEEAQEEQLSFKDNASIIEFSPAAYDKRNVEKIEDVILKKEGQVIWFNIYGLNYPGQIARIAKQNNLDAFVTSLVNDTHHRTKAVELDNCFFFTAKSIHFSESNQLSLEQMMFIVSKDFIWSIQEKRGDNFQHIRERLAQNVGHVRQKKTDYLLFLIMESIVDNYYTTYADLTENANAAVELNWSGASPQVLEDIESRKSQLFRIRKSLNNLREAIYQVTMMEEQLSDDTKKYITELREQAGYLIDQIDNDLQRLESATNLFFSLQSHRLNEVMKTLTILSAVFIPLTFIAGIYGMNFQHMPELGWKNGYFFALGLMLILALGSVLYFKRKGWFS